MLPPLVRRLSRLAAELAVLIAFWWAGGWLAKAIGLPLPGGVVGLAALLLLFASGLLRPAWLQAGAGLLLAEMLLFFIPALMSLLDSAITSGGITAILLNLLLPEERVPA
uniref:CidA/LrgA family protein n=1 Tax=Pseudomonas aeruginosa TaxID=287 RepID=UPI001F09C793